VLIPSATIADNHGNPVTVTMDPDDDGRIGIEGDALLTPGQARRLIDALSAALEQAPSESR